MRRTRGCAGPSLRARIVKPKLCQSMTMRVSVAQQTIREMRSVGSDGGF